MKVIAIKDFLSNFKYNITSGAYPEGVYGVDHFLFSEQEGFCTNFASAMVVMLRSVGVPARLNTGYRQLEADEITGNYIIRSQHYHAWAEAYFPGYGWIEFETTPLSAPDSASGTAATIANIPSENEELLLTEEEMEELGPIGGTSVPATRRPTLPGPKLYVYFIVIGTLFLTTFTIRSLFHQWHRRLRRVETPTEAYDRMCYLASLGRSGPAAYETPLEYGARLALVLPEQAEDIGIITQAYLHTMYSPRKEVGEQDKSVLQKSWVQLCSSLLKHLLRLRSWLLVRMVRPRL
ncbi:transglutaminase domain-containing protein [Chloroflexota bacterium]